MYALKTLPRRVRGLLAPLVTGFVALASVGCGAEGSETEIVGVSAGALNLAEDVQPSRPADETEREARQLSAKLGRRAVPARPANGHECIIEGEPELLVLRWSQLAAPQATAVLRGTDILLEVENLRDEPVTVRVVVSLESGEERRESRLAPVEIAARELRVLGLELEALGMRKSAPKLALELSAHAELFGGPDRVAASADNRRVRDELHHAPTLHLVKAQGGPLVARSAQAQRAQRRAELVARDRAIKKAMGASREDQEAELVSSVDLDEQVAGTIEVQEVP